MLSAEHLALQSRLVQQLAAVKQKEIAYLLQRYEAIGVQAALLVGCCLQTLVSLEPTHESVHPFWTWFFFTMSAWCTMANLWVILCTLYISNWAPGLTLRGPTGSLNRAFDALVRERRQINVAFVFGIFTFVLQTVAATWVLKDTEKGDPLEGYGLLTTIMAVIAMIMAVIYLRRMHSNFFPDDAASDTLSRKIYGEGGDFTGREMDDKPLLKYSGEANTAAAAGAGLELQGGTSNMEVAAEGSNDGRTGRQSSNPKTAAGEQRRGSVLMDNPLTAAIHAQGADLALGPTKPKGPKPNESGVTALVSYGAPASFEFSGYLYKRVGADDRSPSTFRDKLVKKARSYSAGAVAPSWQSRFFHLSGTELCYWHSEEDFNTKRDSPRQAISLDGYEVLINTTDSNWGFELRPTLNVSVRTWWFRAGSEDERLEWTQRLVAATYMSNGPASSRRASRNRMASDDVSNDSMWKRMFKRG